MPSDVQADASAAAGPAGPADALAAALLVIEDVAAGPDALADALASLQATAASLPVPRACSLLLDDIPRLCRLPASLERELDLWSDCAISELPHGLASWRGRAVALLKAVRALCVSAAGSPLAAALLPDEGASSSDEVIAPPKPEDKATRRARQEAASGTALEQVARALEARDAAHDDTVPAARLLLCLDVLAGSGSFGPGADTVADAAVAGPSTLAGHMPAGATHSAALAAAAGAALEAFAAAVGLPAVRLRKRLHADVCRCLNAELNLAQARRSTHRTRLLCAGLAHGVVSLPRPHLSKASGAHKLLPLLLRWADLVDAPARTYALRAVRHCVDSLPAAELRWHGALLLHTLRKLLVHREATALAQLLPAFFNGFLVIGPTNDAKEALARPAPRSRVPAREGGGFAGGGGAAGSKVRYNDGYLEPDEQNALWKAEEKMLELLDTMVAELQYIAPSAEARRVYLRELPKLLVDFSGDLVIGKMKSLLEATLHLLQVRGTAPSTARALPRARAPPRTPLRQVRPPPPSLCRRRSRPRLPPCPGAHRWRPWTPRTPPPA